MDTTESNVLSIPDYDPYSRYEQKTVNSIVDNFVKEVLTKRHPYETDAKSLIQVNIQH